MTAIGNVRLATSDCRKGTAERAEYNDMDQSIVLSGDARVWPPQGWPPGDDIFMYVPRASSGHNCPPADI